MEMTANEKPTGQTQKKESGSQDAMQHNGIITIIGVGNLLLSDEGVGVHVVRSLAEQLEHDQRITCIDAGTLSYELLEWVATADAVLLIDAAQLDAPAGTVAQFSDHQVETHFALASSRTVHQISVRDVLNTARILYQRPRHWTLIGIQPSIMTWGDTLSEPVAQNLPTVFAAIADTLRHWGVEVEDTLHPPCHFSGVEQ